MRQAESKKTSIARQTSLRKSRFPDLGFKKRSCWRFSCVCFLKTLRLKRSEEGTQAEEGQCDFKGLRTKLQRKADKKKKQFQTVSRNEAFCKAVCGDFLYFTVSGRIVLQNDLGVFSFNFYFLCIFGSNCSVSSCDLWVWATHRAGESESRPTSGPPRNVPRRRPRKCPRKCQSSGWGSPVLFSSVLFVGQSGSCDLGALAGQGLGTRNWWS